MTSREHGLATAGLERFRGYPAYFYTPGDGDYIHAVDHQFGLPVRMAGDAGPDIEWLVGFNLGVRLQIAQHGLPWNSRLASLDVLADLAAYFRNHEAETVELSQNSREFRTAGFGFALALAVDVNWGQQKTFVKLTADSLFRDPGNVPGAMGAYRCGPPPSDFPETPFPPAVGRGMELVSLRFFIARGASNACRHLLVHISSSSGSRSSTRGATTAKWKRRPLRH